jgi:hypothetical protein
MTRSSVTQGLSSNRTARIGFPVADTIAREERRGFLARLAAFDFEAKRLEVERRTLPPGLGHSSVCGVIHLDAKGTALDDAVVLFSCGPFVGSADLIGRR